MGISEYCGGSTISFGLYWQGQVWIVVVVVVSHVCIVDYVFCLWVYSRLGR